MARTTIEIDDVLFTRLKIRAAEEHRTLKNVFTELLSIGLKYANEKKGKKKEPFSSWWKPRNCGKFPFDVSSRDAMYEFFDKTDKD